MPRELNDRAADNWRPLFAIADVAGDDWPQTVHMAALALVDRDDEGSAAIILLGDIRDFFEITMVDRTKTEDVLQHLHQIDERPWAEWRRGSPMTATQLAAMLKPFGVKPITIRFPDTGPAKGYHRASFDDAFSRYLGSSKVTPLQPNDFKGLNGPGTVTRENDVTASQHSNSLKLQPCYDVTAESTATDEREQDSPAQSPLSESRRRVAL